MKLILLTNPDEMFIIHSPLHLSDLTSASLVNSLEITNFVNSKKKNCVLADPSTSE